MKRILPFLLFACLSSAPLLAPAQDADPSAPTHGVKSAEQIDKEWQDSVSKFDLRRNALLQEEDRQAHDGPYRPDWETLRNHEIPQWFKDAKFGIFIGWGVYAVPGAVNEWYPHNMYQPGDPAHEDFVKRVGPLEQGARLQGFHPAIPRRTLRSRGLGRALQKIRRKVCHPHRRAPRRLCHV